MTTADAKDACDAMSMDDCKHCLEVKNPALRCTALCVSSGVRCRRNGLTKAEYIARRNERKGVTEAVEDPGGITNDLSTYLLCYTHWRSCDRRVYLMKQASELLNRNTHFQQLQTLYNQLNPRLREELWGNWNMSLKEAISSQRVAHVYDRLKANGARQLVDLLENKIPQPAMESLRTELTDASDTRNTHWNQCRKHTPTDTAAAQEHLHFIQMLSNLQRLVVYGLLLRNRRREEESMLETRQRRIDEEKKKAANLAKAQQRKSKELAEKEALVRLHKETENLSLEEKKKAKNRQKAAKKRAKEKEKKALLSPKSPKASIPVREEQEAEEEEAKDERPIESFTLSAQFVPGKTKNLLVQANQWKIIQRQRQDIYELFTFYVQQFFNTMVNAPAHDFPLLQHGLEVGSAYYTLAVMEALSWFILTRGYGISPTDPAAKAMYNFFIDEFRLTTDRHNAQRGLPAVEQETEETHTKKSQLQGFFQTKKPEKSAEKKQEPKLPLLPTRQRMNKKYMNAVQSVLTFLDSFNIANNGQAMHVVMESITELVKQLASFMKISEITSDAQKYCVIFCVIVVEMGNLTTLHKEGEQIILETDYQFHKKDVASDASAFASLFLVMNKNIQTFMKRDDLQLTVLPSS